MLLKLKISENVDLIYSAVTFIIVINKTFYNIVYVPFVNTFDILTTKIYFYSKPNSVSESFSYAMIYHCLQI